MFANSSIETDGEVHDDTAGGAPDRIEENDCLSRAYECENNQSDARNASEDAEDQILRMPSLHGRDDLSNSATSCIEEAAIPSEVIENHKNATGEPEVEKTDRCARKDLSPSCVKNLIDLKLMKESLLKSESMVVASQKINYTSRGAWTRPGAYFVRIPLMWQRPSLSRSQVVDASFSTAAPASLSEPSRISDATTVGPVEATAVPNNNKGSNKAVRAKRNKAIQCNLPDRDETEELAIAVAIVENEEDIVSSNILQGIACDRNDDDNDDVANQQHQPRKCHRRLRILCLFGTFFFLVATLSTLMSVLLKNKSDDGSS